MKRALLIPILAILTQFVPAQETSSSEKTYHFDGNVSVTNNGFSLIPSFSLGKPALMSDFSMGGERFSFDPQFRFDLEGFKPWSFIFIWRYRLVQTDRFQLKLGAHFPVITFKEVTFGTGGDATKKLVPNRFLTPEITPTFTISEHIGIGMYYIYGLGLEKEDQTRNTHFISLRAYFNRIPLAGQFFFSWNPQVYYLDLDGTGGFYAAYSLAVGHQKMPLSLSTMMNFKIISDIETKDFDWNISLVYSFSNRFMKK